MLTTAVVAMEAVKVAAIVTVPPGASEAGAACAVCTNVGSAAAAVTAKVAAESVQE